MTLTRHNVYIFRWKNILPYDHTRIKLMDQITLFDDEKCDYINASWLTTASSKESNGQPAKRNKTTPMTPCSNISFMSCQGPTPITLAHHLQMIYEQKADIVVMLTKLIESTNQGKKVDKPVLYNLLCFKSNIVINTSHIKYAYSISPKE